MSIIKEDVLILTLKGVKMKNVDGFLGRKESSYSIVNAVDNWWGKSDPFFQVFDNRYRRVAQSKIIQDNLNPEWPSLVLPLKKLCENDLDKAFHMTFYDWEEDQHHQFMGHITTTVSDILEKAAAASQQGSRMTRLTLRRNKPEKKGYQLTVDNIDYGTIVVEDAQVVQRDAASLDSSRSVEFAETSKVRVMKGGKQVNYSAEEIQKEMLGIEVVAEDSNGTASRSIDFAALSGTSTANTANDNGVDEPGSIDDKDGQHQAATSVETEEQQAEAEAIAKAKAAAILQEQKAAEDEAEATVAAANAEAEAAQKEKEAAEAKAKAEAEAEAEAARKEKEAAKVAAKSKAEAEAVQKEKEAAEARAKAEAEAEAIRKEKEAQLKAMAEEDANTAARPKELKTAGDAAEKATHEPTATADKSRATKDDTLLDELLSGEDDHIFRNEDANDKDGIAMSFTDGPSTDGNVAGITSVSLASTQFGSEADKDIDPDMLGDTLKHKNEDTLDTLAPGDAGVPASPTKSNAARSSKLAKPSFRSAKVPSKSSTSASSRSMAGSSSRIPAPSKRGTKMITGTGMVSRSNGNSIGNVSTGGGVNGIATNNGTQGASLKGTSSSWRGAAAPYQTTRRPKPTRGSSATMASGNDMAARKPFSPMVNKSLKFNLEGGDVFERLYRKDTKCSRAGRRNKEYFAGSANPK